MIAASPSGRRLSMAAVLATCLAGGAAAAELQLANVFGDRMVLQRAAAVPVWGRAAAGDIVTVEFAGQTKTAPVAADGGWKLTLDPLEVSAEPRPLTVLCGQADKPVVLADVLVGDVWLCGGQSNMAQTAGPDAAAG